MPYHQYVGKASNVMILCVILLLPAIIALCRIVYFLHYRTKRFEEQQTQNKVTDAVNDVIVYPAIHQVTAILHPPMNRYGTEQKSPKNSPKNADNIQ